MAKPLPPALTLIGDSWRLFISTWNDSVKISIWFLYLGLASFALGLLASFSEPFALLAIPLEFVVAAFAVWTSIRLIRGMLQLEAGKKINLSKEESTLSWNLVLPLIWVAILVTLAVLGGTLLFIIPGIYLAVVLSFSQILVLDQNLRGTKAMAASRDLVTGRFGPYLWRVVAGGLVFGIGLAIVTGVCFSIIAMFAGPDRFTALSNSQPDPLLEGTITLFQSIIEAATLPLFIGFQVKLYRMMQRSK